MLTPDEEAASLFDELSAPFDRVCDSEVVALRSDHTAQRADLERRRAALEPRLAKRRENQAKNRENQAKARGSKRSICPCEADPSFDPQRDGPHDDLCPRALRTGGA